MKIVDASFEIVNMPDGREVLKMLEKIGRVCYKSENRIEKDSAEKFLRTIIRIRNGHEPAHQSRADPYSLWQYKLFESQMHYS